MHPWGKFWRLLARLGADSAYQKALQDDPATVASALAADDTETEGTPWRPAVEDWSMLHELLAQIRDRQGDIAAILLDLPVAVKSRHKPPQHFPRPLTELDRARIRIQNEKDEADMARIDAFVKRGKENWKRQHAVGDQ